MLIIKIYFYFFIQHLEMILNIVYLQFKKNNNLRSPHTQHCIYFRNKTSHLIDDFFKMPVLSNNLL